MARHLQDPRKTGSEGGKRNVAKHGREHMAEIAKIGRERMKERDPEYGKKLAQLGLQARLKKQAEKKKNPMEKVVDILNGK